MFIACGSAWRAYPRLVQAQVHPPARAVRSRLFVSAGPFCRGSFALGTGRSPRRKPHVHCMWNAWRADPRLVQARRCSNEQRLRDSQRAGKSQECRWAAGACATVTGHARSGKGTPGLGTPEGTLARALAQHTSWSRAGRASSWTDLPVKGGSARRHCPGKRQNHTKSDLELARKIGDQMESDGIMMSR